MNIKEANKFNQLVTYAPNGFGKTTKCRELNDFYVNEQHKKTLFFTRKNLENLVSLYKDKIYLGESSKYKSENDRIEDLINYNEDSLMNIIIELYGYKQSGYLNSRSLLSLDIIKSDVIDIEALCNLIVDNDIKDKTYNNSIKLDKTLKLGVYKQSLDLLEHTVEDFIKEEEKNCSITSSIMTALKNLKEFSINKKECPLCGHSFESSDKLQKAINDKFSTYILNKKGNLYEKLLNNSLRIKEQIEKVSQKNDFCLEYPKTAEPIDLYNYLKEYCIICKNILNDLIYIISNIKIENKTIKEYCVIYLENEEKINRENNEIGSIKDFNNTMLKEFNKIISINPKFEIVTQENSIGLLVLENGERKDIDFNNFLSESELKRFVLSVFATFIKFKKVDVVILDDPIDSYDDYYIDYSCNYIMDTLTSSDVQWTIFTNSFTSFKTMLLFNSVNIKGHKKIKGRVLFENPKCLVNFKNYEKGAFVVRKEQLELINNDELCFLNYFVNKNNLTNMPYNADIDIIFLGMILTLRNFSSNILQQYTNIKLFDDNQNDIKEKLEKNISVIINDCYLHCRELIDERESLYNSNNINVSDVCNIFKSLSNDPDKLELKLNLSADENIIEFRDRVINEYIEGKKKFNIINYIFFKIVYITSVKFNFEKVIIDKMSYFGCNDEDIKLLQSTHCLKNKIEFLKTLVVKYGSDIERLYESANNYWYRHSSLINSFEHGLERMIPPYIATSFKDLRLMNKDLEDLKSL